MGVIAYRNDLSISRLNELMTELLPDNLEGFHAILLCEDRYSLTRHVPAASFNNWERGIIFGEKLQLEWRLLSNGNYGLVFISEKNITELEEKFSTIREPEPIADGRSILVGEFISGTTPYWHAKSSSKPLDYPVPGRGSRVVINTRSYRLPDQSIITRFKGVTEC